MTNGPGNHSTPGIIARGCLMGAADIVPGVSGGTMALITGIYGRLLNALGQIPEAAVLLVRQRSIPEAFRRVDGAFLLLLLTGILISVISLAHGIGYLLENHERLVRGFFFGLVVGAIIHVGRQVPYWRVPAFFGLAAGTLVAWGITQLTPAALELTPLIAFGAGFIAISAMILPGISGSFILLLLGLYEPVLGAVRGGDLAILTFFATGCALGLVAMARAVSATLDRYPSATLAVLAGIMLGSLANLWPWRVLPSDALVHDNLGPLHYAQVTGEPHQVLAVGIVLLTGIGLVMLLERFSGSDVTGPEE
jgi:putative membrane protein